MLCLAIRIFYMCQLQTLVVILNHYPDLGLSPGIWRCAYQISHHSSQGIPPSVVTSQGLLEIHLAAVSHHQCLMVDPQSEVYTRVAP